MYVDRIELMWYNKYIQISISIFPQHAKMERKLAHVIIPECARKYDILDPDDFLFLQLNAPRSHRCATACVIKGLGWVWKFVDLFCLFVFVVIWIDFWFLHVCFFKLFRFSYKLNKNLDLWWSAQRNWRKASIMRKGYEGMVGINGVSQWTCTRVCGFGEAV